MMNHRIWSFRVFSNALVVMVLLLCCVIVQEACKTYSVDLISVDLSQRMDSMLFGKSARAAVGCVCV